MLQDCRKKGSNPPDFQLSAPSPSPSFPHSNGKLEARRHDGLIWRRIRDVYRLGSATSSFVVDNGVVTSTRVRDAPAFSFLFPLQSQSISKRDRFCVYVFFSSFPFLRTTLTTLSFENIIAIFPDVRKIPRQRIPSTILRSFSLETLGIVLDSRTRGSSFCREFWRELAIRGEALLGVKTDGTPCVEISYLCTSARKSGCSSPRRRMLSAGCDRLTLF